MRARLGWIAVIGAMVTTAGADDLPRYRLEVGQKLTYMGFAGEREDLWAKGNRTEATVWVVDRAGEDGWQVVVQVRSRRMGLGWFKTGGGSLPAGWGDPLEKIRAELNEGSGAESVDLGMAVVHADGRTGAEPLSRLLVGDELARIFPILPADAQAARDGWEAASAEGDRAQCVSTSRPGEAGPWIFTATRRVVRQPSPETTTTATYRFDRARGLIVGRASTGKALAEPAFASAGHLELTQTDRLDAASVAQFRAEAARFHPVQDRVHDYENLIAGETVGDASALASVVTAALADARRDLTLPPFTASLAGLTEQFDMLVAYNANRVERRKALLGTAAPAWELKDLDGRSQTLQDQRGKVVVLDFWYRACGACMQAMPTVQQIATQLNGRPVAVFGMNTDSAADDARAVARAFQLTYPTLRIEGTNLAESYGATTFGFPTLIVIDRKGIIRDIQIGFDETMAKPLKEMVERLLDEP